MEYMDAHTYENSNGYKFLYHGWSNLDCNWLCDGAHAIYDNGMIVDVSYGDGDEKHSPFTSEGALYSNIKVCRVRLR